MHGFDFWNMDLSEENGSVTGKAQNCLHQNEHTTLALVMGTNLQGQRIKKKRVEKKNPTRGRA